MKKKQLSSRKIIVLFTLFSIVLVQCDQFILYDELRNDSPESQAVALAIAPVAATLTANASLTFTASGGTPPYSYSITSGSGTIDAVIGIYSAPPGASTDLVRVTDSAGVTNDAAVTVTSAGALGISPPSVSLVTNGTITFSATGGMGPYTFSLVSGGGSIDAASGAYTAPSTSGSATIRVTDSQGTPETADALITVSAASALSISPSSIVLGTGGSVDFGAFGGVAPYNFSVVSGGGSVVPATGVYTAPSTAGSSTIRVTDSDTPPAQIDAIATVYEPLRIVPESMSISVSSSFVFSATGGKTPYTFTLSSGSGTINANTGVYNAPATPDSVVIRVTDDLMNTREASLIITTVQPLVITPSSKTLLTGDSVTFTATGGTSPYTFSILAPADGSINSATGEYTTPGTTATDIIRVTDAITNTSDATVNVVNAGPLSISPDAAVVPVNGQKAFSASGGAPPYSFSVVTGAGSINAFSGVYSAPGTAGSVTVRVTDSLLNNDTAAVTVAGAVCGMSFVESEPNNDTGPPWTNVNNFGIELVPGCTVTITGVTDIDDESDVFAFNKGSANFVTFIVTWNSGGNELDLQLYDAGGNDIAESDASTADSESLTWAVSGGSPMNYIEIVPQASGGVSYTLIISAH